MFRGWSGALEKCALAVDENLFRRKRDLQEKIGEAHRIRNMGLVGVVVGTIFVGLGLLTPFSALFILGYTVLVVSLTVASCYSVMSWHYARMLRKETARPAETKPFIACPRCGKLAAKNTKYCPKCGKSIRGRG